jgi:hypothetical protein
MKRMVIFGGLGPPIAFVVSFWALIPLFNWSVGGPSVFDLHQLVLLPMFYIMGLGPALLAGLFDDYLAGRGTKLRVLWCGLGGLVVSFIPILGAAIFFRAWFMLLFGLVGAIPAIICSWMAGPRCYGLFNY